jgi:predicted nucleotidyltransferase
MRLSLKIQAVINQEVLNLLGKNCRILLFGSRTDDQQRGGDIDLLIESPRVIENRLQLACQLSARLYIKLGGRKVDVLIKDSRTNIKPIHQQAIKYGIPL